MGSDIGKKVINYRWQHNVTIRELAEDTGLSSALISQLERGIGNPTLSALVSLAEAMGITVSELVSPAPDNGSLVLRAGDQEVVRQDEFLTIRNVLVENAANTSLSVQQLVLQPHGSSGAPQQHLEEECLYILRGELTMVFNADQEEYRLQEGDSIRVMPNRLHTIRNDSDNVAVAMNIKCKVKY